MELQTSIEAPLVQNQAVENCSVNCPNDRILVSRNSVLHSLTFSKFGGTWWNPLKNLLAQFLIYAAILASEIPKILNTQVPFNGCRHFNGTLVAFGECLAVNGNVAFIYIPWSSLTYMELVTLISIILLLIYTARLLNMYERTAAYLMPYGVKLSHEKKLLYVIFGMLVFIFVLYACFGAAKEFYLQDSNLAFYDFFRDKRFNFTLRCPGSLLFECQPFVVSNPYPSWYNETADNSFLVRSGSQLFVFGNHTRPFFLYFVVFLGYLTFSWKKMHDVYQGFTFKDLIITDQISATQ